MEGSSQGLSKVLEGLSKKCKT